MRSQLSRHFFIASIVLVLAATATTAGGCSPAQNPPAPTVNAVVMKNFNFSPMNLTVTAGATVTWKNLDGEPHTVTSTDGLFRSGALDQNDTFTFKFATPGVYKYVCSIHPKMMAAIIVK